MRPIVYLIVENSWAALVLWIKYLILLVPGEGIEPPTNGYKSVAFKISLMFAGAHVRFFREGLDDRLEHEMAARSQSHRCSEFYSDRRATSPLSIGFPSKNKYLGHLHLPHWYQAVGSSMSTAPGMSARDHSVKILHEQTQTS